MNRSRYILSLIITTVIYILLGLSMWFLLSLEVPKEKPQEKIIKIKMIEPKRIEAKAIKKTKPAPKPKPKVIPKPKPVLKSKPKVILKPKPVLKPKPAPKPKIETKAKKEVSKQLVQEKVYEKIVEKEVKSKDIKEDFTEIDISFTKKVREKIIKNKKYPRSAIRRNIQGLVKVIFDIEIDGDISNIRIDTDSKILEKATRKSLKKSFPIDIPSEILDRFPKRNIHVNIEFHLYN